jgi:adenosylcobyric acid synthase
MNPVLLKPQGDSTSEVILNGRPAGIARAESYYQDWFRPGWQAIRRGLEQLKADHPAGRLVLEGAGSPVEMNLQPRDLTNLRLAQFLRARCLLVADIERGGVFAQLVGTLALLRPVERPLIRGILINRFRGRRELFDSGRRWLEERTGVPVLGVMPWLNDLFPPEDSLDLLERRRHKPGAEIEIAVLRLPSLSNFSDLDPLEAEPGVRLRWVRPGETLGQPDAVLLPGSKRTLADLAHLRQVGLDDDLRRYAGAGGAVFGVCGGLQMLGVELDDPGGFDGAGSGPEPGLGLLPLRTRFTDDKLCRQRRARPLWPPGAAGDLVGFELHRGRSEVLDDRLAPLGDEAGLGWVRGEVAGTYLHGVFDDGPWRRSWLNRLRQRRGLPPLPLTVVGHSVQREAVLDRLADAFEAHVRWQDLLAAEGGRGHG